MESKKAKLHKQRRVVVTRGCEGVAGRVVGRGR